MSLLDYNEIREKKVIVYDDEPCLVVSSHVARTQMRKPTNQTKLKSLLSGKVFAAVFQASDSAPEADIEKRDAKFIFAQPQKNEYWFCNVDSPKERFALTFDQVSDAIKWIKPDSQVLLRVYVKDNEEEVVIGVETPIKVDMMVKSAPPNVKGDTATGGKKIVTLENGTEIGGVPLFIEEGDIIRINTELGEYVERVEKK